MNSTPQEHAPPSPPFSASHILGTKGRKGPLSPRQSQAQIPTHPVCQAQIFPKGFCTGSGRRNSSAATNPWRTYCSMEHLLPFIRSKSFKETFHQRHLYKARIGTKLNKSPERMQQPHDTHNSAEPLQSGKRQQDLPTALNNGQHWIESYGFEKGHFNAKKRGKGLRLQEFDLNCYSSPLTHHVYSNKIVLLLSDPCSVTICPSWQHASGNKSLETSHSKTNASVSFFKRSRLWIPNSRAVSKAHPSQLPNLLNKSAV